jgi:hypothetical protein
MRTLCGALTLGILAGCAAVQAQGLTAADYPSRMKMVAQTNQALNMKLKGGQVMEAAADAKTLSSIFAEIEKFWAANKKDDAVKLAMTAREGFADAAAAAAGGDAMKAQMAAANALGTCKQCHGLYREGNPQEGFRFKAGVLP